MRRFVSPAKQGSEKPLAPIFCRRLKPTQESVRENRVVPEGLTFLLPLTQHSAFGYVLGYDIPRLRRWIFRAVVLHCRYRKVFSRKC